MRGNQLPVSAARFPDVLCNFYFVKNYKIAKNSKTTKAKKN
jgi:hypothetical protein